MTDLALKTAIRVRVLNRTAAERKQFKLFQENDLFHETVRSRLDGLWDAPQFWNFCRCGNERFYRTCKSCGAVHDFLYACNIKWCPRCQWRIARTRKNLIALWTQKISQPKHMVLTQKNFPILTRKKLREHIRALAKVRRLKCMKEVRGGCISVEITNEGNGWHLHSHWLVDADWLSMPDISQKWGSLVGQEFAIVKVKDVRNTEYLQEVSKYVVEGSELAKWPREHINEFVQACRGVRFFFSFGSMFKLAPIIRAELEAQKPEPPSCECGDSDFVYESEVDAVLNEIRSMDKRR